MKKASFFLIMVIFTIALTACSQTKKPTFNPDDKKNTSGTSSEVKNDKSADSSKKMTDTKENQTEDADGGSEETSSDDDTASTAQKINYYVACINRHSGRVLDSFDRYLSWVDEKNGPTGKERNIYGLYAIYETKGCLEGLTSAKALTPHFAELEKAGDAYSVALTKVEPLILSANDYYEQQNYKDDAMAKGKEMHAPLVQAWQEFEKNDKILRDEVDKINDDLTVKELARLEKSEGRKVPFLSRSAMSLAKKVMKHGNVSDVNTIPLADFTKSIEEYEKTLTELTTYTSGHKDELGGFMMIDSFISESKEFLTAAKELMRRVRDKEPYSTGDKMNLGGPGEWMVDGSPGKLLNKYNSLIQTSNNLGS